MHTLLSSQPGSWFQNLGRNHCPDMILTPNPCPLQSLVLGCRDQGPQCAPSSPELITAMACVLPPSLLLMLCLFSSSSNQQHTSPSLPSSSTFSGLSGTAQTPASLLPLISCLITLRIWPQSERGWEGAQDPEASKTSQICSPPSPVKQGLTLPLPKLGREGRNWAQFPGAAGLSRPCDPGSPFPNEDSDSWEISVYSSERLGNQLLYKRKLRAAPGCPGGSPGQHLSGPNLGHSICCSGLASGHSLR